MAAPIYPCPPPPSTHRLPCCLPSGSSGWARRVSRGGGRCVWRAGRKGISILPSPRPPLPPPSLESLHPDDLRGRQPFSQRSTHREMARGNPEDVGAGTFQKLGAHSPGSGIERRAPGRVMPRPLPGCHRVRRGHRAHEGGAGPPRELDQTTKASLVSSGPAQAQNEAAQENGLKGPPTLPCHSLAQYASSRRLPFSAELLM